MSRLVSLMRATSVLSRPASGNFQGRLVIASRMGQPRVLGTNFAHRWPVVRPSAANFQHSKNENANHDQNENEGEGCVNVVVEHNLAHLINILCWRQHLPFGERRAEKTGMRQEADRRVAVEYLLQAGR